MKRHAPLVVCVGVLLSISPTAGRQQTSSTQDAQKTPPSAQQPPIFRTEANFVRVDAFPTKDGKPLFGLAADDFEILEDGVPQRIQSFEHVVINTGTPPGARMEPNSVREAERMAANPRNRVFVVFLDVPHVEVEGSHHIKEPLIRLLSRMMGPDDLVAVMTPLMTPTEMTFGRKTEVIEQQLRENWPWGRRYALAPMDQREMDYENCFPPKSGETAPSALARALIERRRERLVLEALHDLVAYLGGIREERKAILTVTEGWQFYRPDASLMNLRKDPVTGSQDPIPGRDPIGVGPDGRLRRNPQSPDYPGARQSDCENDRLALSSMDNDRYFRELLDVANRWNASFYPIDPRGLPAVDDPIGPGQPLPPYLSQARLKYKLERLKELAENTDGLAILNNNDLDKGLRRISDDLTSYYLLGYYSTNTKLDGTFRTLKVRVKAPGVAMRARRGYRAANEADVRAARAAASAPVAEATTAAANAVAALARIRADVPFVLRAVAAPSASASEVTAIWIAGELQAVPGISSEGGKATIEIFGGGASEATEAELKAGERAFLIRVPLSKPLAQADVRARFVPTGPAGTLPFTYTATVAATRGLPEPLIFRRGLSTANRLQPAANLQFSRSDRVRLEVPMAPNDKPGPGRLLDKNGQPSPVPVAISERTDAASSQRWLVADVTLAPLGAGDYVVELSASSGTLEKKVMTAIRVGR